MRPKSRTRLTAIVLLFALDWAIGAKATPPLLAVFSERSEPAAIVSIVPEGSRVERGQVVCALDPGNLKERLAAQKIATSAAEASYQNARLTREVAEIAVIEYTEGLYKQDMQTILGEIDLAKTEKLRAKDRLEWSKRMLEKGFVSVAQNIADKVSLQQKAYAFEQATTKLKVLEDFTKKKTIKELQSEVEKARADEQAKQAIWERERLTLSGLRREVAACTLVAPAAGKVIYARPQFRFLPAAIVPGATVRPEQLVFLVLPTVEDPEVETGETEPAADRDVRVFSEVEGRSKILSIVPGGTQVQRGDLVCELDSSALRDQLANQVTTTRGAEAAYQNARLTREVAELAVDEYAEGVSRQEKAKLQGEIELAKERISLAREQIERAGRIPEPKEADFQRRKAELDLKQEQQAQEQASDQLRLLTKYTHPRTIKALKTEAEKARNDEPAKQAAWEREKTKQARLERQITRCKIVAPEEGTVVYDQRGPDGKRLIEPGAIVRHRQLIFRVVPAKPAVDAPK